MPARPVMRMSQNISMVETIDENSPLPLGDTIESTDRNGSNRTKNAVGGELIENDSREKKKKKSSPDLTSLDSKRTEKKVHWNPKTEKRRHFRVKDIPQEEREHYWYSKEDDKLILAMAKVTVKMIMKGEPFDDIDYCSRGLEVKTPSESKKRSRNKRKVLKAVKMEQELQRLEGVKNPDHIAIAARKVTVELSSKAYERGMEDELAVEEYLSDTRLHRDNFGEYLSTQSSGPVPN